MSDEAQMQPPAFSGLEEECHGTMGWAKNSEELRRTVTKFISQCKVKGISGYPCSICQSHSHLLDFHELNEASNGSAGLKASQGIALSKSALQDLPVGLHPRARRLVHPVFPNVLNTFFWKTIFFFALVFALFSFLLWRSAGWCCDLLFIFSRWSYYFRLFPRATLRNHWSPLSLGNAGSWLDQWPHKMVLTRLDSSCWAAVELLSCLVPRYFPAFHWQGEPCRPQELHLIPRNPRLVISSFQVRSHIRKIPQVRST